MFYDINAYKYWIFLNFMNSGRVINYEGFTGPVRRALIRLPEDSIISPYPITVSQHLDGVLLSLNYVDEESRRETEFYLPRGAELLFNEPFANHAWWRPRDIRNATTAIFKFNGIKYTFTKTFAAH